MTEETRVSPIPKDRSPNTMALDNLVRRKLRVSDPSNPAEIAKALKGFYGAEKQILEQEAAGLPFVHVRTIRDVGEAETSTRAELRQAMTDIDRDLQSLLANPLLKDVWPELRGWSSAIRKASADGTEAARLSLDPRQRDRAMSVRRLLGGYARMARYVGALTPTLSPHYRQLAKSLDEVGAVILVAMGDALAQIGCSGGRFLLQAAASDLQGRRDAVIYSLRNLTGSVQDSYGPNDWPRGLVAYRQFLSRLEESGHGDLRALFDENYLANLLDELVHWATSGAAEDIRALGATAYLNLERCRRLINLGRNLVSPESPPLLAYLGALQLFLDAFVNGASGHRLLYVSRPPIVFYGLYGIGGADVATDRLLKLIAARGRIANMLDCYLGCECGTEDARCQIMLDKILYDLDRAIDLHIFGTDFAGKGEPEQRAAAFAILIELLLEGGGELYNGEQTTPYPGCRHCVDKTDICAPQWHQDACDNTCGLDALNERLVKVSQESPAKTELREALEHVAGLLWWSPGGFDPDKVIESINNLDTGENPNSVKNLIFQELCMQQDAESQWKNLVHAMAPSCHQFNHGEVLATRDWLQAALNLVKPGHAHKDAKCPEFSIKPPPHIETSLDMLVEDHLASGEDR